MKRKTIPGIYNYCDRWCERCGFTQRCAIYDDPIDTSRRRKSPPAQTLWDHLSGNLAKAKRVLEEAARTHGTEMTLTEAQAATCQEQGTQLESARKQHPLLLQSLDYDTRVFGWMASMNFCPENMIDQSILHSDTVKIRESTEVISWYSSFIHVKLSRALSSVLTTDDWAEENGLQKDSDGSAKIAVIAIERSADAWQTLYHAMDQFEDDILSFLVSLEQLKKITLDVFPNAMQFIRPGFDTLVSHQRNL